MAWTTSAKGSKDHGRFLNIGREDSKIRHEDLGQRPSQIPHDQVNLVFNLARFVSAYLDAKRVNHILEDYIHAIYP